MIQFKRRHKIAAGIGISIALINLILLFDTPYFIPIIGIAITIIWLPHWSDYLLQARKQKEAEEKFPEFVRNFTGAIKSGIPAAQAVVHVSNSDYGSLNPYVKKLANQLEWGIPFHQAFINFGRETESPIIKRAIATMIQAEQAGGNIEDVLLAITDSLIQIKKIREERRTSIHSQVMQGYIIFIVFLGVIVLIQNLLIPYMAKIAQTEGVSLIGGPSQAFGLATRVEIQFSSPQIFVISVFNWLLSLHGILLMLSIIQGMFAGMVLGKLSEGDIPSGLKHSVIMATMAFLVITLSQGLAAA